MAVVISVRNALLRKDVFKMFEIKGKITTAICYAKVVEDEAIGQIRRMCDHDLTKGSKVRIMPDVHAGKGCTIGTTMTVTDLSEYCRSRYWLWNVYCKAAGSGDRF